MKFGVCCGPGSFAPEVQNQAPRPVTQLLEMLTAAGADFAEFCVGAVTPDEPDSVFDKLHRDLSKFALRVEAFNSFIPPKYPITGPQADLGAVLGYCRRALPRCRALGGEVVVLGSGAARRFPAGFPREKAEAQFIAFCKELGPIAERANLTIAIEPLNSSDDNLCVRVDHGARLVDAVNHPRIQLLADMFHIAYEHEPYINIFQAGSRLRHVHVADVGRVAPGFAAVGEENFIGLFKILRQINYPGRCSFEGKFDDIDKQTPSMIAFLKKRWLQSGE
jgi:sugar phosphate isomerase/epimerase